MWLTYENKQKHPDTNVLKVWPSIDVVFDVEIMLIQYFDGISRDNMSSRMR